MGLNIGLPMHKFLKPLSFNFQVINFKMWYCSSSIGLCVVKFNEVLFINKKSWRGESEKFSSISLSSCVRWEQTLSIIERDNSSTVRIWLAFAVDYVKKFDMLLHTISTLQEYQIFGFTVQQLWLHVGCWKMVNCIYSMEHEVPINTNLNCSSNTQQRGANPKLLKWAVK